MKFKLGQKVKYKKISKKIKIVRCLTSEDFEDENDEKIIERREIVELDKERVGFIMGRRKLVFRTVLSMNTVEDDDYGISDLIDIVRQIERFAYVVAYNMGKTDYVLEEDLGYICSYLKNTEEINNE